MPPYHFSGGFLFVADSPTTPDSHPDLLTSNGLVPDDTEYLEMARKGGGHSGNFAVTLEHFLFVT